MLTLLLTELKPWSLGCKSQVSYTHLHAYVDFVAFYSMSPDSSRVLLK